MKTLILSTVLLAFLSPLSLHAQNYRPGTITLTTGETRTGDIWYNFSNNSPAAIRFRDANGTTSTFTPLTARALSLTRKDGQPEQYVGRIVWVNRSATGLTELETDPLPRMVRDTLFLQVLLESQLSLYSLNQNNHQQFLVEKDDSIHTLIYKQFYRNDAVRSAISENNMFRQQLMILTLDQPDLQKQILALPYKEKNIQALLQDYSQASNAKIAYKFQPERIKVRFHLIGGAHLYDLQVTGLGVQALSYRGVKFQPEIGMVGGIGIELPIPKTNQKVYLATDIVLKGSRSTYETTVPETGKGSAIKNAEFDFTVLRINSMIRYRLFNREQANIYAAMGGGMGRMLSNRSGREVVQYDSWTGEGTPVQQAAFKDFRNWELGLVGGLGFNWRHWGLEARYERGSGFSAFLDSYLANKSYGLLLSYRL